MQIKIVLKVYKDYIPPSSYNIEINPQNKEMYVKETEYSSVWCGEDEYEPDIE